MNYKRKFATIYDSILFLKVIHNELLLLMYVKMNI